MELTIWEKKIKKKEFPYLDFNLLDELLMRIDITEWNKHTQVI